MHPQKSNLVNLMNTACIEATRRILRDFNELGYLKANKNIADFVNRSRLMSYEDIKKVLAPSNYGHGFIFNDEIEQESETGFYWMINPIDSTSNFSHKLPFFGICVVLVQNYSIEDKELNQMKIISGMLFDPIRNESFSVERGKGSFFNNKVLRIILNSIELIASDRVNGSNFRNFGSSAFHLSYLAAGKIDAVYQTFDNKTNFAFGKILVEEAGGEIKLINNKIAASSFGLISALLQKIEKK